MDSRRDRLAAQKAQVALVFQKMLGKEEARAYLVENNFAEATIDRILNGDATRKRATPAGNGGSVTLRGKAPVPPSVLAPIGQRWRNRQRRPADQCD